MQAGERYAIGIDYGSNSVRCLIVDCFDGREAGVAVWNYRGGEAGVYLAPNNPHVARQCPGDFIDGLTETVPAAIKVALEKTSGFAVDKIAGLGKKISLIFILISGSLACIKLSGDSVVWEK